MEVFGNRSIRYCKHLLSIAIAVALVLSAMTFSTSATQSLSSDQVERFNVMMVIDGSGSLVAGNGATDPNGLRYDAIDLFLALLTDSGNNVGAIVFDDDSQNYLLNTGVTSVSGKASKLELSKKIRDAGTRNDTDIGSALLSAINVLSEESQKNSLPSVVLLFSDGRTDLGGDQKAYDQSIANKDAAITLAQEKGIPIHSLCLNASPVADPAELKAIATRTSGSYVEVDDAKNLTQAFEKFYNLIFATSSSSTAETQFQPNGRLTFDFDVPSFGAEEVNLIMRTENPYRVVIDSPSKSYDEQMIDDATMSGGPYDVIKLVNPEKGKWTVKLQGNPNEKVVLNIIYNVDSTVILSTESGEYDYGSGETVNLFAKLYQGGKAVEDPAVTSEYTGVLHVTNKTTGETKDIQMEKENGTFKAEASTKDVASFDLVAELTFGDIKILSNTVELNFANTPPTVVGTEDGENAITEKVVVTPITGRNKSYDISKYFEDAQGDEISYSIQSSQLVDDTYNLDGSTLKVNTAHSKSGDVVIRATDSQGASSDLMMHFKVTNLTLAIFLAIVAAIVVVIVLAVVAFIRNSAVYNGQITVENVRMSPGSGRSHGSFRRKLPLAYFVVGDSGFNEKKCVFLAQRGGGLRFRSPTPFYVNGMELTEIDLFSGPNELYIDEQSTTGIRVIVSSNSYY